MSNSDDLSSLQVNELKSELKGRGLNCSGSKSVLIERLKEVLLFETKESTDVKADIKDEIKIEHIEVDEYNELQEVSDYNEEDVLEMEKNAIKGRPLSPSSSFSPARKKPHQETNVKDEFNLEEIAVFSEDDDIVERRGNGDDILDVDVEEDSELESSSDEKEASCSDWSKDEDSDDDRYSSDDVAGTSSYRRNAARKTKRKKKEKSTLKKQTKVHGTQDENEPFDSDADIDFMDSDNTSVSSDEVFAFVSSDLSSIDSEDSDYDYDYLDYVESTGDASVSKHFDNYSTTWDWVLGQHKPKLHEFDASQSGGFRNLEMGAESSELDYFKLFIDDTLMEMIVAETNKNYVYLTENGKVLPFLDKWQNVSVAEMHVFLGLCLLMSHVRKLDLDEYWSENSLTSTPIYPKMMSKYRFFMIMQMLHFSDCSVSSKDILYEIRPVYSYLRKQFSKVLYPFKDLLIDESQILFKGRVVFVPYVSNKKKRYAIKVFVVCDKETGFVLDLIIHNARSSEGLTNDPLGKYGAAILEIMDPYFNKGHSLFVGKCYSSPQLLHILDSNKVGACGMVHACQKFFPKFEPKCPNLNANGVLAVKWNVKSKVHFLTTLHCGKITDTGERDYRTGLQRKKLDVVVNFARVMKCVKRAERQFDIMDVSRLNINWYCKLFFHLLDISVLNSYRVYQMRSEKHLMYREFRLRIAKQMCENYIGKVYSSKGEKTELGGRLSSQNHFPKSIKGTGKRKTICCYVCSHSKLKPQMNIMATHRCSACKVALCIIPCFEEYHTQDVY